MERDMWMISKMVIVFNCFIGDCCLNEYYVLMGNPSTVCRILNSPFQVGGCERLEIHVKLTMEIHEVFVNFPS